MRLAARSARDGLSKVIYLLLWLFFVPPRCNLRPNSVLDQVLEVAGLHTAYHTVDKDCISWLHMLSALASFLIVISVSQALLPSYQAEQVASSKAPNSRNDD